MAKSPYKTTKFSSSFKVSLRDKVEEDK